MNRETLIKRWAAATIDASHTDLAELEFRRILDVNEADRGGLAPNTRPATQGHLERMTLVLAQEVKIENMIRDREAAKRDQLSRIELGERLARIEARLWPSGGK